jgi:hypothetical protein
LRCFSSVSCPEFKIEMDKLPNCDICGRSETDPQRQSPRSSFQLERDEDGLRICDECRVNLSSAPTGSADEDQLDDRLKELVGKSAGAICHTLNLPYSQPYKTVIKAASEIAYDEDRYMSTWSFVTQWGDGTTVWQSADRSKKALVYPDGGLEIQEKV